MNGFKKFDETKSPRKSFYSLLRDEYVSNEDYEIFEMKTVGDYHNSYLETDVFC